MNPINNPKVAAIQMVSTANLQKNLATADELIARASQKGAQVVVLPEYFCFMGLRDKDKLSLTQKPGCGLIYDFLADSARKHKVHLVGGTIPVTSKKQQQPYSRCYVFSSGGEEIAFYDKIHLFDVNVNDNTNSYRESNYCTPGDKLTVFDLPWAKAGIGVCYDIRFFEMFRQLTSDGCKIIFVPAAFTQVTGAAHWHVLLRARAIENQVFVIAAAQGGVHENRRETYGHSCIISPWGEVIAEHSIGENVVIADLDLVKLQKIREEFPVLHHTRL